MNSELKRRLYRRATADEQTYEDVISRLLDETTAEVSLEEVIETAIEKYDDVASVCVDHHSPDEPPMQLRITVFTGEAKSFQDQVGVFDAKHRVVIPADEEDVTTVPFEVVATFDGPRNMDGMEGTPVYMSEDVVGAEPLELDKGIRYLREKLGNPEWEPHQELLGTEAIHDRID